ncbi:hypothetical protein [Lentzea sp. NBRC 102530]|uniref:hypothetical protein n=1 Tax=Lentzea sp. NBRC 102530 TaxID=3032201 RepID=UPI00255413A4|nr:hypothetical protein [Lentzea sp. NBRC 102530]
MYLWDYEMREVRPLVDALSPRQSFALAVRAIRHLLTFDQDLLADTNPAIADFARRSLDLADEAVAAGRDTIGEPDGYADEADELLRDYSEDSATSPEDGADAVIMALLNLYGEAEMAPSHAYETLSSAYEAVLIRQRIWVVTPETERENTTLVQLIAQQKDLVRAAGTP